ncbi:VOC family protein [Plantactinospora soyae]|uniref:Catechol 2,3-dioxygenase-like lactoylglutathione lyase family enzyme n=1 Tax=Plantactinospora soyae TaxID=1544732 RepID=A0A927M6I5_9ACTN|nr:VOC family protein [Plantactinospora soyae]MBE1487646.1 catechol 2,3-dioxygenase-like lactoylglutathione lyase family enzyme [Plantactinospora soyae]
MIGQLRTVVIDCPDPRALAGFYAEMLGLPVDHSGSDDEDGWTVVGGKPGQQPRLAFQRASNLREPRWPDPDRPQQFHLDVTVDDIEVAEAQVLKLGATRLPGQGDGWRVYADPSGHPFCLCWDD